MKTQILRWQRVVISERQGTNEARPTPAPADREAGGFGKGEGGSRAGRTGEGDREEGQKGREGRRKPTASLSQRQSSGAGETKVPEFPKQGIKKESWSAQDVSSRDQKELSKRISGVSALTWAGKSTWSHQPDRKSYYSLGIHKRVFPWGREIISPPLSTALVPSNTL